MSQERNFGVTEAGLGLTVITFLLVALGYWVVQRLGGTGETPPVEVRPSQPSAELDQSPRAAPIEQNQQPQVLVAEQPRSTDSQLPYTANRPQWLSHQEEPENTPIPGIDGILTPLSPDAGQSLWPPLEPDSQRDPLWPEPLQVR